MVSSNVDRSLPLTKVNHWYPKVREYRNIERPNCILFDNKHMGFMDTLDSLVSILLYWHLKEKWYWLHFINKIDVLKSAALKIIKITNPESRYRYFTVYPKSRDTLFESSENLETDVCQQYLSPQKILEGRICSRIKWKNRRTTINRL